MAILLTCPGCSRQMTIPDESRGATVRCPACNTLFASVADPYSNPTPYTAVQVPMPPAPMTGPGYVEVASDKAEAARPAAQPAGIGRDVRWDDEDPMSIGRKPADPLTTFVVLGGVAMLGVVILVFTAFIWPGFLRRDEGVGRQGPHDLLSLAPADSVLMCGMNFSEGQLRENLVEFAKQPGTAPILKELIEDAERVMLAVETFGPAPGPTGVLALLTKSPYDRDKIKSAHLDAERIVQGTAIYTMKQGQAQLPLLAANKDIYVAMVDPRLLVIGVMPEDKFVNVLANRGKAPMLPADLEKRIRQTEASQMWLLLANRGAVNEQLKQIKPEDVFPLVREQWPMIQRARSLSLVMRTVNKNEINNKTGYRFELGLECADNADAKSVHQFAKGAWNAVLLLGGDKLQDPAFGPVVNDVTRTFKVEQHGATVVGSAEISEKSIRDMDKQKNR